MGNQLQKQTKQLAFGGATNAKGKIPHKTKKQNMKEFHYMHGSSAAHMKLGRQLNVGVKCKVRLNKINSWSPVLIYGSG